MVFWRKKTKTPQELLAAGDFKGAISGFEELLKDKKEVDPAILMQLAGAYLKANKLPDAKRVFIQVGTYFGDRGFFNKSVAAFKKALLITPDDTEILEKLASYNDKVPKFMIDSSILAKLKQEADSHKTGEHSRLSAEDLQAAEEPVSEPAQEQLHEATEELDTDAFESIEDTLPQTSQTYAEPKELSFLSKPPSPKSASDETYEEIVDLDMLEMEDEHDLSKFAGEEPDSGFEMNFGQSVSLDAPAKPSEPVRTPPPTPSQAQPPAPTPGPGKPLAQKFEQPITRGGMVFKTQVEPQKPSSSQNSGGFFDNFDDALDNIFSPGSGGGIFAAASANKSSDSHELTLADASPEENAKHWPLFRTMPQDVFMAFVLALETRDYEIGEHIVTQGDAGDEMFLIADGQVDILVNIGGTPTKVAQLKEGDFFGEASLLSGEPRNATVRAAMPTNCLLLNRTDLNKLLKDHPSVMASIESIYYTRIQENASRKREAGK